MVSLDAMKPIHTKKKKRKNNLQRIIETTQIQVNFILGAQAQNVLRELDFVRYRLNNR
jgi:hypothetical protein